MKKILCLTLPLFALASSLSACSGGPTLQTQSQSAQNSATQSSAAQGHASGWVSLSREGSQALTVLRTGSPNLLVENQYLNELTTRALPDGYNERGYPYGEMRWAHTWAQDTFNAMRTPVGTQWIRAFMADGSLSPEQLVRTCQHDGTNARTCTFALEQASHAAVERLPGGDWVVILAKFDTPIRLNTSVIYY